MKRYNFWRRKITRRIIQMIGSRFFINPSANLEKTILVAGTARSGTTWLGDLIVSQIPCRVMFEPFNPDLVPEYSEFNYFQYMRPDIENAALHAFAEKVFTGEIRNRWIDRQNERIVSEFRLVKEIRANLSLKWLHNHFPEVPIVFLIRHPCAVVASRMELGWATDSDIEPFLVQPDLVNDYLEESLDLFQSELTEDEKHAVIWSISNLVPLKQFNPGEIKIVYYENLCTRPEKELADIFAFIGQKYTESIVDSINRPSQTTLETSPVVTGTDRISNWQKKLTLSQTKNILHMVGKFGLDHLYGESLLPLNEDGT